MPDPSRSESYSHRCPLQGIVLPDIGEIKPSGLTVIVGPNSSGKTQLLQDIYHRLTGLRRQLVVAERVLIEKTGNFSEFVSVLDDHGLITQGKLDGGEDAIFFRSSALGIGGSIGDNVRRDTASNWFNQFSGRSLDGQDESNSSNSTIMFLKHFGWMFATALFLKNRLTACDLTNSYNHESAPPQNDMQALHTSPQIEDELIQELHEAFGKWIWLDRSIGGKLCLRVSEESALPTEGQRYRFDPKARPYRQIESEGDGLRSYAAICMALLLSQRPICLIDEPETCLHPPQAYRIGRFIGQHATTRSGSVIVATHSSHVLRGIMESSPEVRIIRLTRVKGRFRSVKVEPETLQAALGRPMVKSEGVLDGIFADAVVVVEADGDRAVYEAAFEKAFPRPPLDAMFLPVSGLGGIHTVTEFLRKLKVPVAVVADLDAIAEHSAVSILESLHCPAEELERIKGSRRSVIDLIRSMPPLVTSESFLARLQEIAKYADQWEQDGDEFAKRELSHLMKEIGRTSRLKRGLEEFLATGQPEEPFVALAELEEQGPTFALLSDIIRRCGQQGLFLVRVGVLENWCADLMADAQVSVRKKTQRAIELAKRIREQATADSDVVVFMTDVIEWAIQLRNSPA